MYIHTTCVVPHFHKTLPWRNTESHCSFFYSCSSFCKLHLFLASRIHFMEMLLYHVVEYTVYLSFHHIKWQFQERRDIWLCTEIASSIMVRNVRISMYSSVYSSNLTGHFLPWKQAAKEAWSPSNFHLLLLLHLQRNKIEFIAFCHASQFCSLAAIRLFHFQCSCFPFKGRWVKRLDTKETEPVVFISILNLIS